MRILTVAVFAVAAMISADLSAQEKRGASSERQAQKQACQRDARMIHRTSANMLPDARERVKAFRRAYVQECMLKAGYSS